MGGYAIIDCENVTNGVNEEFANSVKEAFSLNKPIVIYNLSFTNTFGSFKLKPTFAIAYVLDGTYFMEFYITESENSNVVISVEGNNVTIRA